MSTIKFNGQGFASALDAVRIGRNLNWRQVADEADVSASTLTRLTQGKRPDVDSLAALCAWSGLSADEFVPRESNDNDPPLEPLAQITTFLRADRHLSQEGVIALEAIIKSAYERLRKD